MSHEIQPSGNAPDKVSMNHIGNQLDQISSLQPISSPPLHWRFQVNFIGKKISKSPDIFQVSIFRRRIETYKAAKLIGSAFLNCLWEYNKFKVCIAERKQPSAKRKHLGAEASSAKANFRSINNITPPQLWLFSFLLLTTNSFQLVTNLPPKIRYKNINQLITSWIDSNI